MKLSPRWVLPTVALCLILSGIAGLAYQVAWARYLALFLGHTSYAVVAVLVAFMGGLALGNAWIGRYADRVPRPLALYAWLEFAIALYAVLFPYYFEFCRDAYIPLARRFAEGSTALLALKFAFSFALILIPTTLMGGTLPVLTRLVTRSLGELRGRVANLYFLNSAGAVFGVVIADFWWIPGYGLETTVMLAALLNFIVGLIAFSASAAIREGDQATDHDPATAIIDPTVPAVSNSTPVSIPVPVPDPDEVYSPFELRLAVVGAGVSGFVAMLYEVVWTRMLALVLGSSTHAFSLMLITFITGIASGAWVVARWRKLKRSLDAFGWTELALATVLLVSMFFYHLLPYGFARMGDLLVRQPRAFPLYQTLQFTLCFAVMFLPALCLGMTLPLATRAATSELARTGRSVGLVFSVNTLGTVLGAALTGLVLLPWLGLALTFALGIALNAALALVVLLRNHPHRTLVLWIGAPAFAAALLGLAQVTLEDTWRKAFSIGLWRSPRIPPTLTEYLSFVRSIDLAYHRDGAGSTVAIMNTRNNKGQTGVSLVVNGKVDATSTGDRPTQILSGHIPLLLKPDSSDVLVVGIGSGMTCTAAATHPTVQRLDAIEISPEVIEAATIHFAPYHLDIFKDPRVRTIQDDAKSFLHTTDRRYDVIVSEPSNPWMAGVANVFSLEYYQVCRSRLKPGGLMAQWVQIYESNDDVLRVVLATFTSVFPFVSVWQTLPGDLILIGSAEAFEPDLDALMERYAVPSVRQDIARADIHALPVLLGLQALTSERTAFIPPAGTPLHSDYLPVLEFYAQRAFFVRDRAILINLLDEHRLPRPRTLLGRYLERHPLSADDLAAFTLFQIEYDLPAGATYRSLLEHWRLTQPNALMPAEASAKLDYPLPISELEALRLAPLREIMFANAPTDPELLRMYSRHLMNAYRAQRSVFHLPNASELDAVLLRLVETDDLHRASHQLRLAELAADQGNIPRLMELGEAALIPRLDSSESRLDFDYHAPARVLHDIIDALLVANRLPEAVSWVNGARASGFLDPEERYFQARLDVLARKVMALAEASTVSP
jgi:spermidine synthase